MRAQAVEQILRCTSIEGWATFGADFRKPFDHGVHSASARQSVTFDRGVELASWRRLKTEIGTEAWFSDPSAPWQKGSIENLNKRARRYLAREPRVAAL